MSNYWPWWEGAVALALITIIHTLATDRFLGVSSSWDRVVHWRAQRRVERVEAQFADDRALAEALTAATPEELVDSGESSDRTTVATTQTPATPSETAPRRSTPMVTHAIFLLSILLGGWIAAEMSGRFALRHTVDGTFRELVTADPVTALVVLFAGGVLVGFGTRLAGGCTSGHGLSGCGLLRPVSLMATAVFFSTAVAVSFLLWQVI